MKEIIWKKIEGFNRYEINNLGQVRNIQTNRILKNYISDCGYVRVEIQEKVNGVIKFKRIYIHRVLAEIFIPNPKNYKIVNHIDGNKKNFNLENLEWCTQKYNVYHAKNILKSNSIISRKKILELYDSNYSSEQFLNVLLDYCK